MSLARGTSNLAIAIASLFGVESVPFDPQKALFGVESLPFYPQKSRNMLSPATPIDSSSVARARFPTLDTELPDVPDPALDVELVAGIGEMDEELVAGIEEMTDAGDGGDGEGVGLGAGVTSLAALAQVAASQVLQLPPISTQTSPEAQTGHAGG